MKRTAGIKKPKDKNKAPFRSDYVTIETADKIKLSYRIANPLLRLGAFAIDFIILIMLFILILNILEWIGIFAWAGGLFDPDYVYAVLIAFVYIILFLVRWGYYTGFELFFEGRTPGKMICRIRTVHYQGKFLDFPSIVLRNFARVVDQDLTFFLGALISMIANREYRRLGDLLGNTIVVEDEKVHTLERAFRFTLREPVPVSAASQARVLRRLSEEDLYVLRRFLDAQRTIPAGRRQALLVQMAQTIHDKIGDAGVYSDPLAYLTSVYTRHLNGTPVG